MYNCRDAYWNCFASVCFWNRVWNFHRALVSRCAQICPQLSWLVLLLIVRCNTHLGQTIWFVCYQPQLHWHFCLQYFTVTYCRCSLSHPFELVFAPPRFSLWEETDQNYDTSEKHCAILADSSNELGFIKLLSMRTAQSLYRNTSTIIFATWIVSSFVKKFTSLTLQR